eukprot:1435501-Amphidinium_carterae.1
MHHTSRAPNLQSQTKKFAELAEKHYPINGSALGILPVKSRIPVDPFSNLVSFPETHEQQCHTAFALPFQSQRTSFAERPTDHASIPRAVNVARLCDASSTMPHEAFARIS